MDWTKSTRSAGNGACVEWRKSTYSVMGDCVEVATHVVAQVRDSKDPTGPVLTLAPASWSDFIAGVKQGQFDN